MASWLKTILNRLDLHTDQTKLVLDQTGVLLGKKFVQFLNNEGINFQVIESLYELLLSIKRKPTLILTSLTEVPSHIEKNINVTVWDYTNLTIDIEESVAETLTVDQIVALTIYNEKHPIQRLITNENLHNILNESIISYNKMLPTLMSERIHSQARSIENHNDILNLGRLWGEYVHLCFNANEQPDIELQQMVDDITNQFVLSGKLKNSFYETADELKSVDKIRAFLKEQSDESKVALVCFDGMGVAEWQVLRDYLHKSDFSFNESYMFSLIPTMTKISRSAIYYGDYRSVYELKSPNENAQFKQFFNDRTCGFFRESDLQNEDSLLGIDLVSIIYNLFDDLAHKTLLPSDDTTKSLYFKSVQNYLEESKVKEQLTLLKELGYKIYFCSDHGCVASKGNGQKIDKYLIDDASKRATLIGKTQLANFYDADHYEIPFVEGKVVLLAKKRTIFASSKVREISHGGITLEELIVPFGEIIA